MQALLWPLDRPRAWVDGEREARIHLESCPSCQAFFRRDAIVSEKLRDRAGHEDAPDGLRERLFDALAQERARTRRQRRVGARRRRLGRLAAAAIVVAAVGLVAYPGGDGGGSAFARDFLSRAVQERRIDRASHAEISAFFVSEFGQAIEPREVANAPLVRAMICLVDGRRAAMVEYIAYRHTVSHYRIPLDGGAGRRVAGLRTESDGGVHAVRWSDDRFEHALVSDLPPERLEPLARTGFGAP